MNPIFPTVLAAALLSSAVVPLDATEAHPAQVEVIEVPEAPFALEILHAQWEEAGDGSYALAVDYAVANRGGEPLAAVGWSLAVETEGGTPKSYLSQFNACDVEPGETAAYTVVVNEKSLGGFELSDRVSIAGTTSSNRRCSWPPLDCNQIQFACEMHCNNPLGTNRGMKPHPCGNCRDYYDQQRECWARTCDFHCECNDVIWPDQMPALDQFLDLDPILEGYPGEPWPY